MTTTDNCVKVSPEAFQDQIEAELNTISWTQIPCTSLIRGQTFYSRIFSWVFHPLKASQCTADTVQSSAYNELNLKPSDPMFVLFRFNEKDPFPHGGFVLIKEDNLLSPWKEKGNKEKAKLSVSATITVRNIDETLEKIVEAGGEVYTPKMEIPGGMGCSAFFLDTEKNVMGLWSEK